MTMTRFLLTGASGFLGQQLLQKLMELSKGLEIVALSHSKGLEGAIKDPRMSCFQMDLTDTKALESFFAQQKPFNVCIHTAALSSPRVCEQEPVKAIAINCPETFFQALAKHSSPLMIALSTDQVYDGVSKDNYTDDTPANPCNQYGRTKQHMEECIAKTFGNYIVLRSSILLGPKASFVEAHGTFLHFCRDRAGTATDYFTDEKRNVLLVQDAVQILCTLIDKPVASGIYNMGGPTSVSRHDMAVAVLQYMKEDVSFANATTRPTDLTVASPLDLSMTSKKLEDAVGFGFQPFGNVVEAIVEDTR